MKMFEFETLMFSIPLLSDTRESYNQKIDSLLNKRYPNYDPNILGELRSTDYPDIHPYNSIVGYVQIWFDRHQILLTYILNGDRRKKYNKGRNRGRTRSDKFYPPGGHEHGAGIKNNDIKKGVLDTLVLRTTDKETLQTTETLIDWTQFESDKKYLEDVDILIESYIIPGAVPGTSLSISGETAWTDKEFDELIITLKRLLSPFDEIDNDFRIWLTIKKPDSPKYSNFSDNIKPLPILEYFHYRISGRITQLGVISEKRDALFAELTLENNYLKNILPVNLFREISLDDDGEYCGEIKIDIRAFDLDQELPIRDNRIGMDEAKKQLKELPGIAVIREGFRVRPYGDRKVDWLGLSERRYNNPTQSLSSNQVAGFVSVWQEDESGLVEKATREGFKEDAHYEGLKQCVLEALVHLERLRYTFRRQNNKGGKKKKNINEQINDISNYDNLSNKITTLLSDANIPDAIGEKVKGFINDEVKEKEAQLEEIKRTIAQYEGQVTLGKIMTVVLHEGRKPLNALRQHPKFIAEWSKEFITEYEATIIKSEHLRLLMDKINDRLNDNRTQAEVFTKIFKKLEPLANSKRVPQKEFRLKTPIEDSFKLFEVEFDEHGITYSINCSEELMFKGWDIDFYIAFANLIENSIYWMKNSQGKSIVVTIIEEESTISIDFTDTGTGIDETNIETQDIFEPGATTKKDGTGLGLSIVGEALHRNRGTIRAISSDTGANFIIELKK